ncbi:hypothetical protein ITF51_18525 [Acinetobacter baumannii]|nr:hypothetical protein [Acinetobacter baumannii]MBP4688533.1 hypothetical protein [Acinetobacter baumannii]
MIATTAMAQEAVSQLPTIHTKATQEESLRGCSRLAEVLLYENEDKSL